MTLHRLNVQLTPRQLAAVKSESKRTGESAAAVIRAAITQQLCSKRETPR